MADTQTPTYHFVKPEVGGSDDTWGTKLNADLDRVEALFKSVFTGGTHTPPFAGTLNSAGMPSTLTEPVIFTNTITLKGGAPALYFEETDVTSPQGDFRFIGAAGGLVLQRATGPNATPWDTVDTIWSYAPVTDIFTFSINLTQVEFNSLVDFGVNGIQLRADTQGVFFGRNQISGAGVKQLAVKFQDADGRFVIADNTNWMSYNPGTGVFDTDKGAYRFAGDPQARVDVSRLDVITVSGNRIIYFGSEANHSESGYIYGTPAGEMVILNSETNQAGFRLEDDIIRTYGQFIYHEGHFLILDSGGDELGRLYPNVDGIILRALATPAGATASYVRLGDNGTLTLYGTDEVEVTAPLFTAGNLEATISAPSLPAAGASARSVAERNRIAAHVADFSSGASGAYGFFHYAGTDLEYGDTVPGNTLRPTSASGTLDGADRSAGETWMCCGLVPAGGPNDENRSTLFRRVS